MLTIIAIVGERDELNLDGLKFSAEKHMSANPRRIERVNLVIEMPAGLKAGQRKKLENAAMTCPVKNSLAEGTQTPVEFRYPDQA